MQVEDDDKLYNSGRRIRKAAADTCMPDAKRQMSASPASIMDTIAQDAPPVVVPSADDVLIQVSAS